MKFLWTIDWHVLPFMTFFLKWNVSDAFSHPCYTTVLYILLKFQLVCESKRTISVHNIDLLILVCELLLWLLVKNFDGGRNLPRNVYILYVIMTNKGLIPGLGRSPGVGNANPLQDSCLKNPVDREARWATFHRVTKSQTQLKWLNMYAWPTKKLWKIKSLFSNLYSPSLVIYIHSPVMMEGLN